MEMNDLILVSVDDHLVESPEMFDNHLPSTLRESAPRMVSEGGKDFWIYGDRRIASIAMNAVVGRPPEEYGFEPTALTGMRRGCWDVHERVRDMDANGILGSLCFASFPGMEGGVFLAHPDKTEALAHLRAYNDWHIDEWCGAYPGRFIPVALMPLWDVNEMVKEIERVKAKGCNSISFTDNPTLKGLPSLHSGYWEPLWACCAANDVVINCHIGAGNVPPHPSPESPIDVWTTTFPMAIALGAADLLHMEALGRYPKLKISLTEGGIGWIPYLLERADYTHWRHSAWTNMSFGGRKPSEVFHDHFITCFIDDKFGLRNLDIMNEDMICYECDYPHSDSVWPLSPELLYPSLEGLSDIQVNKLTHLNAMREFKYDPFSHFKREDCTVGALRARSRQEPAVDLSYLRAEGAAKPLDDGEKRIVTSGDIYKLFA